MDFLRLHLPGLHQALRGALDSLSTFVSYLVGDGVPTTGERDTQAAKELEKVDAGKPRWAVEETAQEALEGLTDNQREGNGGLTGPGEAERHQEGSLAAEQTWGWGESSSHGSQADRQETGVWETAKSSRCQEPSAPLEATKMSEAGSVTGQDRSSQDQERQEPDEQEVNRGETLKIWEQEGEEEEEVRAREPGVASGAESAWCWHKEPEGKVDVVWPNAAGNGKETEQEGKEVAAELTREAEARGTWREEELAVVQKDGHIMGAQEPQGTEAELEVWTASGREEARTNSGSEEMWTTLGGQEADQPVVRGTDYGAVLGERSPEGTKSVWFLDEASKGEWVEEVDENRETEESLFPKQTQTLGTEGVEEGNGGQAAGREVAGGQGSEEEVGKGFEGQADRGRKEIEELRAGEVVQAVEAQEERGSDWATEAGLPQDEEAKGAEGEADLGPTPEDRPEKVFTEQRSDEEAQRGREVLSVEWEGLKWEISEGQEPELMRQTQSPTKTPEGRLGAKEELCRALALGKQETERNLGEESRDLEHEVLVFEEEAWRNERRRGVENGNIQEKADAEEVGEKAAIGQPLEVEAKRGQESERLDIPGADGEGKKAEDTGCGTEEEEALEAENREPGGCQGAEARTEARESKDRVEEATVLWGADRTPRRSWRLVEASLSLQAAQMEEDKVALAVKVSGVENRPEKEAEDAWEREFKRGWDSDEREEFGRGRELSEAQHGEATEGEDRSGQEFSLGDSEKETVSSRGHQREASEAKEGESEGEQIKAGESAGAEGSGSMDRFTSGSQVWRAEEAMAIGAAVNMATGEQTVEKAEVGGWQEMEQEADSEGQCRDHHCDEGAQKILDVEDVEVAGGPRLEAEEIGEAEELEEDGELGKAEEAGEVRDAESAKEAKMARETEEAEEAEEAREAEDIGQAEDIGEAEEAGKVRDAEGAEEAWVAGETEEAEEAEDIGQAEEIGEARETEKLEKIEQTEEAGKVRDAEGAEEARVAEEAGEAEEAREAEETEEAGESEEAREAEETEEAGEAEEAREAEETEEAGEAEEASEAEETEEAGESEEASEAEETEEAGESEEAREAEEIGQAEEAGDVRDADVAKEAQVAGETEVREEEKIGEAEEPEETEEAGEVRDADGTEEARVAGETEEIGIPKETGEAEEVGETKNTEETREAEDVVEAEEVGETKEAKKAEETGEAGEAAEVWEAEEAGEAKETEEAGEVKEADLEGMEGVKKEQSTAQEPPETEPEASETMRSAREGAHSSWSEQALLPGSLLDVSVPRSRALLSRSSSQRRSRPSFRRTPAPGPHEEPPSLPSEAEPSAPQQRLLQSEDPPEPSRPRPEGTPVPARRRPLGLGFGLAHPGMMQELQARLGQPKPQ